MSPSVRPMAIPLRKRVVDQRAQVTCLAYCVHVEIRAVKFVVGRQGGRALVQQDVREQTLASTLGLVGVESVGQQRQLVSYVALRLESLAERCRKALVHDPVDTFHLLIGYADVQLVESLQVPLRGDSQGIDEEVTRSRVFHVEHSKLTQPWLVQSGRQASLELGLGVLEQRHKLRRVRNLRVGFRFDAVLLTKFADVAVMLLTHARPSVIQSFIGELEELCQARIRDPAVASETEAKELRHPPDRRSHHD